MKYKLQLKDGKLQVVKSLPEGQTEVIDVDTQDVLVYQGGEIKAVGDSGKIEGYAVIFSDSTQKDLLGDWFTKSTDFFFGEEKSFNIPFVLYHHGQNKTIGKRVLGRNAKAIIDDVGVFVTAELSKRDKYEKAILKMVKDKKLGYSTGSATHLVARKSADGQPGEIISWPLIELSLTPTPVETKTLAVPVATSIKSFIEEIGDGEVDEFKALEGANLEGGESDRPETKSTDPLYRRLNQYISDVEESGFTRKDIVSRVAFKSLSTIEAVELVLTGSSDPSRPQLKAFSDVLGIDHSLLVSLVKKPTDVSVKGLFEDTLAEDEYKTWELWSCFSKVVSKIVSAAIAAPLAGASNFDWEKLLKEAVGEYSTRLTSVVKKQIEDYMESENTDYRFYLRALGDPTQQDFVMGGSFDIQDHCSLAVSAFKSVDDRVRKSHVSRTLEAIEGEAKAGRILSKKYQDTFRGHLDEMSKKVAAAYEFLDSLKPKASEAQSESVKARAEFNSLKAKRLQVEIGVSQ